MAGMAYEKIDGVIFLIGQLHIYRPSPIAAGFTSVMVSVVAMEKSSVWGLLSHWQLCECWIGDAKPLVVVED